MAVRQEDVMSSMTSILKKMDVMMNSIADSYEESVLILGSLYTETKSIVSVELKKQTTILSSIEKKLSAKSESKSDKNLGKNLGIFSDSLKKIIESVTKLDDKSGDKIKNLFDKIDESLQKIEKNFDTEKSKAIGEILGSIGTSTLKFGVFLTLYTVLAPTAMLGAFFFGRTIRILMRSIDEGPKEGDSNYTKSLSGIFDLSKSILLFGLSMVAYSVIGPFALFGTILFGSTISILLKTSGTVSKDKVDGIASIVSLAKSVLLFGLSMIVYAIISVPAMIGAVLFGLTIRLLLASAGAAKDQGVEAMKAVFSLSKGILLFALDMIIVSLIASTILTGTIIIAASLYILSFALNKMSGDDSKKGVLSLIFTTIGIALLGLAIAFFSTVVSVGDAIFTLLTIAALGFILSKFGDGNNMMKGSAAIGIIALSIIALTFALALYQSINFGVIDGLILLGIIIGLAFIYDIAGSNWTTIMKGSLAFVTIALSLLPLTYALKIYKDAKMTMGDAGMLALILVGLGVIYAAAGAAIEFIVPGAISFAAIGISLIIMAYALEKFQELSWTDKNTEVLRNAITGVLSALSGTDKNKGILSNIGSAVGQGLQAIISLLSIGPLILGSAAIWLMSEALIKFQTVSWNDTSTESLGKLISTILNSLSHPNSGNASAPSGGASILDTILALMNSGALVFASASIWLMSEALIKFQTVKWNDKLTDSLSYTIKTILDVIENSGKGGFWAKLVGLGKAGANATALGIASISILGLSEALIKWESVKNPTADALNITSFVNQLLDTFDPIKNKKIGEATGYMTTFTSNITQLASTSDQLTQVADNFDRMQKSMKQLKDHVNGFDMKKLSTTDSMIKSLAVLSKSGDIAGKIGDSVEKALKELADAIKEISKDNKGTNESILDKVANVFSPNKGNGTPAPATNQAPAPTGKPGATQPQAAPAPQAQTPPAPSISKADIQSAMVAALTSTTIKTRVVTGPGS